jgi:hypothetical protein
MAFTDGMIFVDGVACRGIASTLVFGSLSVVAEPVTVTVPSVLSESQFGAAGFSGAYTAQSVGRIGSLVEFGLTQFLASDRTLDLAGIPSTEGFGKTTFLPPGINIPLFGFGGEGAEKIGSLVFTGTYFTSLGGFVSDRGIGNAIVSIPENERAVFGIDSSERFGIVSLIALPNGYITSPSIESNNLFGKSVFVLVTEGFITQPGLVSTEKFGRFTLVQANIPGTGTALRYQRGAIYRSIRRGKPKKSR